VDDKGELKNYKDKYINMEIVIENLKQNILDDFSQMEAFKNLENEKQIKLYDELANKGIKLENRLVNIPSGCQAEIYKDI